MSFAKFTHLLDPIGRTLSLSMLTRPRWALFADRHGVKQRGAPIINGRKYMEKPWYTPENSHWNIGWTPKMMLFQCSMNAEEISG